ncbi:WRKY domain-containing protein [Artemisia annua]|uniref:WRKY domain-containing protein n=1 Tax=Artemisia annua TaxID=35608 RepID=A0A2U1NPY1_ARTAN|nr:WRKY domain-containing protein [Artemisia annua]
MAEQEVFEDDLLIRELLQNEPPFLLAPQHIPTDSFEADNNIYSGPTITDIETALLASSYTNSTPDFSSLARVSSSDMERGMSGGRVENSKYILKMKSSSNVMADDGYKWRKYGQKSIKNSSNPRSYYKCTNPHCGAKKQVERSNDDPDTLIITYEGLHLHYMYPFFMFGQSENPDPPTKKFRRFNFGLGARQRTNKDTEESIRDVGLDQHPATMLIKDFNPPKVAISSQGLLEDMTPTNPSNDPDLYFFFIDDMNCLFTVEDINLSFKASHMKTEPQEIDKLEVFMLSSSINKSMDKLNYIDSRQSSGLKLSAHLVTKPAWTIKTMKSESDGLSGQSLHEDLHSSPQPQHKMKGRFLLDVVICQGEITEDVNKKEKERSNQSVTRVPIESLLPLLPHDKGVFVSV